MSTGKRNKQRGYEHEAELVKSAEAAGFEARRAWGSNGKALGEAADVDLVIERRAVFGYRKACIQAKRRKKLADYLQIPESCDAVVFRQDRGDSLVLLRWDDYLSLLDSGDSS